MEEPKKPSLIAGYLTRLSSVGGDSCHIRYAIYSNGVVVVEKRMFIDGNRPDWELVRMFRGRAYCKQSMAFRYRTLANILGTATRELMIANIKGEDLA